MNEPSHPPSIKTFKRAQWAALTATVLSVVSMVCYPGGTAFDHATPYYRLTQNFLSDLGMTVAYDGQPNMAGAALFVLSLGLLILGFGSATLSFIRLYSKTRTSRNLAWGAGIVGLAISLSFAGVGLTPENSMMELHVQFTLFAFRAFPVASTLLLLASWKSGVASKRIILAWALATVSLTAYVVYLTFGTSLHTLDGFMMSVIAQKSVTVAILVSLTYLCHETARTVDDAQIDRPTLTSS